MKRNQLNGLIIAAIVLVTFNALVFLCPFERTGVFWTAYIFTTLAILLQVPAYVIAFASDNTARSKFYGFPIIRISSVYLAVQLILGFALMIIGSFVEIYMWIAVVPGVLLLAAASLGLVSADATLKEIERQDDKTVTDVAMMRKLQSTVNYLTTQSNNAEVAKAVKKLSESLRYSDPVSHESLAEAEAEIAYWINELQNALVDNDNSGALDICAKVEAVLAERNHLCKLSKIGK